jgi:hypothetical protein
MFEMHMLSLRRGKSKMLRDNTFSKGTGSAVIQLEVS